MSSASDITFNIFLELTLTKGAVVIHVDLNEMPYNKINLFLNSFLASGKFCRLMITFATSLDPDQDLQSQTVWYSDSVTEIFF